FYLDKPSLSVSLRDKMTSAYSHHQDTLLTRSARPTSRSTVVNKDVFTSTLLDLIPLTYNDIYVKPRKSIDQTPPLYPFCNVSDPRLTPKHYILVTVALYGT
ncbi:unnamed protein product, partial [Laminaria digitata]